MNKIVINVHHQILEYVRFSIMRRNLAIQYELQQEASIRGIVDLNGFQWSSTIDVNNQKKGTIFVDHHKCSKCTTSSNSNRMQPQIPLAKIIGLCCSKIIGVSAYGKSSNYNANGCIAIAMAWPFMLFGLPHSACQWLSRQPR